MTARIKVIGVGGGGGNAVRNMLNSELRGVDFICANTDAQALANAPELVKRVQIGEKITRGLGAGADPRIGHDAASESIALVKEVVGDANMIFVTAGMGGGTGTGAAPVIAQTAKEMGILTVGVVTKPFHFEGGKRQKTAEQGIAELRQHVDSLIIIPNDRLLTIAPKNAKIMDMFKQADEVLYAAVRGIADLITTPGYINLDFADVRTAMAESGYAMMGAGRATGESRAMEAARMAIFSPLLEDVQIAGAKAVLINVTATPDMSAEEFGEAMYLIREAARGDGDDGHIFMGMAFDENAGDEMRITVIATGIDNIGHSQTVQTSSGARVTNLGGGGRGGNLVQPSPAAIQAVQSSKSHQGEVKPTSRRNYGVQMSEELSELPAYIRVKDVSRLPAKVHTPGGVELCNGEEEPDLPLFIRRQAN